MSDTDKIAMPTLEEIAAEAAYLLSDDMSEDHYDSASGRGLPLPSGRMSSQDGIAVGADRLPKAGGQRTGRHSKRARPGVKAGQAVARGPHPRERSGEIALDTARIPRL